jgi:hypothetical protein
MPTPTPPQPAAVWKTLARLIAAPGRAQMRVWSPDTDKFSQTRPLRDKLPTRPAAVYLYNKRRTRLLAMDFDTKRGGHAAVDRDLTQAIAWITQCGGVSVTDRSATGGRHLLVPLAIGTSASFDEIARLMRLLAARLPTLDINPNLGPAEGCLTPPGSPCKQGGYRQLDGTLQAAHDAFTTRSAPDLLPQLYVLLGTLTPSPHTPSPARADPTPTYTIGEGDNQRLAPAYVRHDPLPAAVHDFATHGTLATADRTWPTPSEARMSVIAHAVWRGHSQASITALIAPGRPWHNGLGAAYRRYRHHTPAALGRDVTKAITWLTNNPLKDQPPQHKTKYTQGGPAGGTGPEHIRKWLANGYGWADQEFRGQRYRWTVYCVLQSLAVNAARAGQTVNGTPVVGVGGRALSLAAGLLSPDTIWRVLRDLRDRPGSPVTHIRPAIGVDADWYALTSQNPIETDSVRLQRARVEDVHPAWFVLGHHHRRAYELIAHHGITRKDSLCAAARVSTSTLNATISALATAGLLTSTGRGTVAVGPVSLDDIAAAHHIDEVKHARIAEYRAERQLWRTWLQAREAQHGHPTPATDEQQTTATTIPARDTALEQAYLESVMATGPPDHAGDEHKTELHQAIEAVMSLLGGRLLPA